ASVRWSSAADLSRRRNRRLSRNVLLGLQAGLATVLLIATGLMTRSLLRLADVDPHFNRHELAMFTALFPTGTGPEVLLRAQEQVQDGVMKVPGVRNVAFSNYYPLNCTPCLQSDFILGDDSGRQILNA